MHRKVIMNLYRKKYGIPDDLRVRKPDADIRMAVHDSEAIKKLELMLEQGLHPSIIFFEKGMSETKIQKVVAQFDASPQIMNIYREINTIMAGGSPQLSIMFHSRKNQYLIKKVPGFVHAPYNFTAKVLSEYCQEHANEARLHARDFVKSQQTKSRIEQVLQRAKDKL